MFRKEEILIPIVGWESKMGGARKISSPIVGDNLWFLFQRVCLNKPLV